MRRFRHLQPPVLIRYLNYGTWAAVLACSLAVYQRAVLADPLTIAQKHWQAIANQQFEQALRQYDQNAVVVWIEGARIEQHQGRDLPLVWHSFSKKYRLLNYQILSRERGDRAIKAKIQITAQPQSQKSGFLSRNQPLIFFHEIQVDSQGKITREVWQTNPELND